jgi:hypothetical protein
MKNIINNIKTTNRKRAEQEILKLPVLQPFLNNPIETENTHYYIQNRKEFRLENYIRDFDDRHGGGGYFSFAIKDNQVLNSFGENVTLTTLDVLEKTVNKALEELKTNNISEKFFIKHYVLTNSLIGFFLNRKNWSHLDFLPIVPDSKYYEILLATEHLTIVKTRFICELVLKHNLTLEEALNIDNLPKEWLEALYSGTTPNIDREEWAEKIYFND